MSFTQTFISYRELLGFATEHSTNLRPAISVGEELSAIFFCEEALVLHLTVYNAKSTPSITRLVEMYSLKRS
jgi:hypothetical protein